jgi:hypothetical protein
MTSSAVQCSAVGRYQPMDGQTELLDVHHAMLLLRFCGFVVLWLRVPLISRPS